jgi:anthranilate phosphoribosyltransferase
MDGLKPVLRAIAEGRRLSRDESETTFRHLLSGAATPAQMGALLMGLRVRGETIEEITGAVAAMRAQMIRVAAPPGAIDIVGTGGDGHGTFNVSTLAAIIVAACGVPVAKHGNRAASSRSGSSDVLTALGVGIGLPPRDIERCLADVGLAFMAAPSHHTAMRHIAAARAELGTRTIFNLLGPLSNPASVTRLLVGVFSPDWLEPLARVLGALGAEKAWLVHGADGLDELTTTGPTEVVAWEDGQIHPFTVTPEALGLTIASLDDLKGGGPEENAAALRAVLSGATGPYRDIACLNAAGGLVIAGVAPDLAQGLIRARSALDTGAARTVLDRLIKATTARTVADCAD